MMRYTPEEKAFLREYIPGHHHFETAEAFSERFRLITTANIKAFCHNNGVSSGLHGREGMPSWNRGKHFPSTETMKRTQFKNGHRPHNWRPVGSERVNVDGYTEIKVAEPRTWRLKQRLVWEREYGPIGKSEIVIFLDGDHQNFDPDNLRCVNRRIHGVINRLGLTYYDQETFDAACTMAKLSLAIADAKRRRKNGRKKADHKNDHGDVRSVCTI